MKRISSEVMSIIHLINTVQQTNLKEFYYKNADYEMKLKISDEYNKKEKPVEHQLSNLEFKEIEDEEHNVIKSKYVAQIKLVDKHGDAIVGQGQYVKKGQKLAEIKYLNLSLPITAPCNGKIHKIFVKNDEMIDYNKKLMVIKVLKE